MNDLNEEKKSLYSITDELESVLNHITDLGGELTQEDEDKLKIAEIALTKKTDAVVGFYDYLDHMESACKQRIAELEKMLLRIETRRENFENYVKSCMQKLNTTSFKGEFSEIKLRKPSKKLVITDELLIPMEYIKTPEPKPVVMKKEITEAIKSGIDVRGAELVDSEPTLIFKTRDI